jgi:hypothetical protein
MKTADLTGAQLDYCIALIEGLPLKLDPMGFKGESPGGYWVWPDGFPPKAPGYQQIGKAYSPSTRWAQGGPIIERETIELRPSNGAPHCSSWSARHPKNGWSTKGSGPTPLIAAMRCFVASKLGPEVDVPF